MSDPVVVFVGFWPALDCCHSGVVGQQRVPRGRSRVWVTEEGMGHDMTSGGSLWGSSQCPGRAPALTCSFHREGNGINHQISVPQHHWKVFWTRAGAHLAASCVRLGQWINREASGEDKVKYCVVHRLGREKQMFQEVAWPCRRSKLAQFHWFFFSYSRYLHWSLWAVWNPWLRAGLRVPGWTAENPGDWDRFLVPGMRREGVRVRKQLQTPSPQKAERVFVG